MTTIAANKNTIACDLQFTYGENVKMKGASKIIEFKGPWCKQFFNAEYAYVGFAGNVNKWCEVVSWITVSVDKIPKLKGIELLALTSNNELFYGSGLTHWMRLERPFFAIGSGSHLALGAMEAGKSPMEAVKVAAQHDVFTGLGYKEYTIG